VSPVAHKSCAPDPTRAGLLEPDWAVGSKCPAHVTSAELEQLHLPFVVDRRVALKLGLDEIGIAVRQAAAVGTLNTSLQYALPYPRLAVKTS
jgi:hypothetical protein